MLHPSRPATTIDGQLLGHAIWANSDARCASSVIPSDRVIMGGDRVIMGDISSPALDQHSVLFHTLPENRNPRPQDTVTMTSPSAVSAWLYYSVLVTGTAALVVPAILTTAEFWPPVLRAHPSWYSVLIHLSTPCSSILALRAHPSWHSVLIHLSTPCSSI